MTLKALTPLPALVMMAAALMLPAPRAYATPMTFTAILSGANELPNPVPSPGTGLATVVLDPTAQTLQINATFSGLTSPTLWRRTSIAARRSAPTLVSPPRCLCFPGSLKLGVTPGRTPPQSSISRSL